MIPTLETIESLSLVASKKHLFTQTYTTRSGASKTSKINMADFQKVEIVFAQNGPFWEGARLLGHGYLTVIIMNAGFLDGKPSQNVRIHRSRPSSPSTRRNSAHARDGEMFMDSEKCAHLSMPVASRARPESELGCHGGAGSWDCHLSPT